MRLMMLLVCKVAHHSLESVIMATLDVSVWILEIPRGSCVLMLDSQLEGQKSMREILIGGSRSLRACLWRTVSYPDPFLLQSLLPVHCDVRCHALWLVQ